MRVVTTGPLEELWDDSGPLEARRVRTVSAEEAREAIRNGLRTFAVADIGSSLAWKRDDEALAFWQRERSHIADPARIVYLENFPDGYVWRLSEWQTADGAVLLFEKQH